MDEFMKKYRKQMDQVTISDTADEKIMGELQAAQPKSGKTHLKRSTKSVSAAMIIGVIVALSSISAIAGIAVHGIMIQSNKAESQIEGLGAKVDVGESSYYDFLTGNDGQVYALTDNDYEGNITDTHAVVWKSVDDGSAWESVLCQPDELSDDSFLVAGDLWDGEDGIETTIIVQENGKFINRVFRITSDSYEEYHMDDVYELIGEQINLFNVKYVNDDIIALIATELCILYDCPTQQIIKTIPYNLSMGCLLTENQFLLYGEEIYHCLNTSTLKEEEPRENLELFIQDMYDKNNRQVMPPMEAQGNVIICVTKDGIFEFQNGETKKMVSLSYTVHEGKSFNGLLPVCKGVKGEYYICTFRGGGMHLWQIDGNKEEMK